MSWAHNGDIELWWERFEGRPGAARLLLINGLGSPCVAYEIGFVERLVDAGFDVIRFDNRDVGRSTRTDTVASGPDYDARSMAADAVAVLDAAGWDRAVVLGQSMGGMIAQQLVIDSPDRVTHLVSFMSGTGNRAATEAPPEVRAALLSVAPTDRAGWLDHRVETERFWASPGEWDPVWCRAKGALMYDHGVDPAGTQRQLQAVMASPPRDEWLAGVAVPTLVLHGSNDTLIHPDNGRHTAACIPGSRYVEIAGLGHDLPPGMWQTIVAEVAAFALGPTEANDSADA